MLGGALGTSSYIVLFTERGISSKKLETNDYESCKMNEVYALKPDNSSNLERDQ